MLVSIIGLVLISRLQPFLAADGFGVGVVAPVGFENVGVDHFVEPPVVVGAGDESEIPGFVHLRGDGHAVKLAQIDEFLQM